MAASPPPDFAAVPTAHPRSFSRCNLFSLPLHPDSAHDGEGIVSAARIVTSADIDGPCTFMDYVEVPPGSSIGDHRHAGDEEEFYLVLSGQGVMRIGDDVFPVTPGDLVRNPPSGLHGLANTGTDPIRLFVFELTTAQSRHRA
jgi:mannose-6-phosphate isomerase-like protein (cupin superfamily)